MKITSKTGETLNFLKAGVDGIYVLDRIAFKDKFDEDGNNDWEKSSGKKKLQEWAEKNIQSEILAQFEVDLPTVEEVFSQKIFNLFDSNGKLKSKQFYIFQNSDNRMMEFDGKPIFWWTKSAYASSGNNVWYVYIDGSIDNGYANYVGGFVPVLMKKSQERELNMKEETQKPAVCFDCKYRRNGVCWLHAIPKDKQDEPCEKFKRKGSK